MILVFQLLCGYYASDINIFHIYWDVALLLFEHDSSVLLVKVTLLLLSSLSSSDFPSPKELS